MDTGALTNGLLMFVALVAFVALHEFAHAWTADRCGDDTPRLQGRVTLDPTVHIHWLGTIVLPLIMTLIGATTGRTMLFGWGRPVEVNLNNFRRRRVDDILVAGAGPAMNVLIAVALLGILKVLEIAGVHSFAATILELAQLSLFLCFFNLLPIPPLDGGHILRNLIGMSDDAYMMMSQYSFIFLILIFTTPGVGRLVSIVTESALAMLAIPFGWRLTFS